MSYCKSYITFFFKLHLKTLLIKHFIAAIVKSSWDRKSFSVFRKISSPILLYYDHSLIKNFYKATNPPSLIKPTPFCAYGLTGRYSSVFFKLAPLPLLPVEYK